MRCEEARSKLTRCSDTGEAEYHIIYSRIESLGDRREETAEVCKAHAEAWAELEGYDLDVAISEGWAWRRSES